LKAKPTCRKGNKRTSYPDEFMTNGTKRVRKDLKKRLGGREGEGFFRSWRNVKTQEERGRSVKGRRDI